MKVTRPHERYMVVTASVRAWMEWVSDNIGFYRNIIAPVAAEIERETGVGLLNENEHSDDIPAAAAIYEG
ncbi:MAG: hypothetical protein GWO10_08420, partial [candidate division Zixibacteria bacterium]|nr:hypothetical protein [candidate division Zixibacteria bacterium]